MGNTGSGQTNQLVTFSKSSGEYSLDVKGVEELFTPHKTLLQVIALCGVQTSGKTLLYQLFIEYLECIKKSDKDPNNVRNAFEKQLAENFVLKDFGQTSGICVQKKPFEQDSTQGRISTFIIDTEGLTWENTQYYKDVLIFCAAMSSNLLFNVKKTLNQGDLYHLKVFVEYGKKLRKHGFTTVLQKLCFVIHDWRGPTRDITTLLEENSTVDDNFTLLQTAFSQLDCWFLPPLHASDEDGDKSLGGLSGKFVNTFCHLAWDLFTNSEVKKRNSVIVSSNELCRISQYCIKLINNHAIEGPKALLRESAMEYFKELITSTLASFKDKLTQIVNTVNVNSEFKELFDAAKAEAFREVKAFPKEFHCLSWYKTESFRAEGTCLGWRFEYKRQFDEKKDKLPAKQKKTNSKISQKQKIKSKKTKKEENTKAEQKTKEDVYLIAFEAAADAHNECLEAGGSWLDDEQYISIVDTSEKFALNIYTECVPEQLRSEVLFEEHKVLLMNTIKDESSRRWDKINASKDLWTEKLTKIAFDATDVYNDRMMKGTANWVSNKTFEELNESAKKVALRYFKQHASEIGADEDMFDTFVKRVKDGFTLFDSELESRRMKNEEELQLKVQRKVAASFSVYEQEMETRRLELPKDATLAQFISTHTYSLKFAKDHFMGSCSLELRKWTGYVKYEKKLLEAIDAEYKLRMHRHEQQHKENSADEIYKMVISSAHLYEKHMQTYTPFWKAADTLKEAHLSATRHAVEHFRQRAIFFFPGGPKLDAYVSNVQYSCGQLFKDILEKNISHELELDCSFDDRVQNAILVYTRLMRESKVDEEKDFLKEHTLALKSTKKVFEDSVVPEEKKWKGYKTYEKKLLEYIYIQRGKLWLLAKEETVDKSEVQRALSSAVDNYIVSMKEAFNSDMKSFEEQHKTCSSQAQTTLTSSPVWSKSNGRPSLELQFHEKVAKEKVLFKSLFQLQQNDGERGFYNKLVEKYKHHMSSTLERHTSATDSSMLYLEYIDQLKEDYNLSFDAAAKFIEGNNSLEFYRNSFQKCDNISQKLLAVKSKLEECENLQTYKIVTPVPFYLPNELLACRGTRLDTGFFSFVKRAWNNIHGHVAVKYYNLTGNHVSDNKQLILIMRGMEEFYLRSHESVIRVVGYTTWGRSLGAVVEYVNYIDYFGLKPLLPYPYFQPLVCARLCLDVASAFAFLLLNPQLVIGDITVDDVLVTRNFRCKVGGFKFRNIINGDIDAELKREIYCGVNALGTILYGLVTAEYDAEYFVEKLESFSSAWNESSCAVVLVNQIKRCMSDANMTAMQVRRKLASLLESRENVLLLSQQRAELTALLTKGDEKSSTLVANQTPFNECL